MILEYLPSVVLEFNPQHSRRKRKGSGKREGEKHRERGLANK